MNRKDYMDPGTFDPTPHRRQQARQEGRFALSRDLFVILVSASGLVTLAVRWRAIAESWTGLLQTSLRDASVSPSDPIGDWFTILLRTAIPFLNAVLPVLWVPIVLCVLLTFFQTGFYWNVNAIAPRPERLWSSGGDGGEGNGGFGGIGRWFSGERWVRCGLAILYLVGIVTGLCWTVPEILIAPSNATEEPLQILTPVNRALTTLLLVSGMVAILDAAIVRWRYELRLRMTPQELKEEQRELQGDPQTAARRQRLRSDLTERESESIARPGDLVLTAQDGSAVLIRYTMYSAHSPEVLSAAIGRRGTLLADRARVRGAVVMSQPNMVKRLIAMVRPGDRVPPSLYRELAAFYAEIALGESTGKE